MSKHFHFPQLPVDWNTIANMFLYNQQAFQCVENSHSQIVFQVIADEVEYETEPPGKIPVLYKGDFVHVSKNDLQSAR